MRNFSGTFLTSKLEESQKSESSKPELAAPAVKIPVQIEDVEFGNGNRLA